MIGSECVTIPEGNKAENQGDDMIYSRNPYECILVNDGEQYHVKSVLCIAEISVYHIINEYHKQWC